MDTIHSKLDKLLFDSIFNTCKDILNEYEFEFKESELKKYCNKHLKKKEEKVGCQFVLSKGERSGQCCNKKICENNLCKLHLKKENNEVVPKFIIVKSKYNNFIDKKTMFVFNSNKQIIGKEDQKGKIVEVNSTDLKKLEKLRMKLSKDCLLDLENFSDNDNEIVDKFMIKE